jgi:PilZ domain
MPSSPTFNKQERRSRIRFSIVLRARYAVFEPKRIEGTGWTVNISSHGVLIVSAQKVRPGTSIRVVIEWPIFIGSVCPLKLYIRGTVIRSNHSLVAVRFSTYEFSTQPIPLDHV